MITESKSDGTTIDYTYGNDLLTQTIDAQSFFYLADALGSVKALANQSENLTDNYTYSPYGRLIEHVGTSENAFMFTGEQYGFESENYYLRARYYSPNSGRFINRDTYDGKMVEPITQNHYAYANSSPSMYVDPSGKFGFLVGAMTRISSILSSGGFASANLAFRTGAGKSVIKSIACGISVSYAKRQYRYDGISMGLHGHHAIPKNVGGSPTKQDLIFIPANTHRMFHFIFDQFLKHEPGFDGKNNWTGKTKWSDISQTVEGRRKLYRAILASSYVVDNICKLKRPNRLRDYVKRYKKDFLGGAWKDGI